MWVGLNTGPDDATERVVDDRHVGSGLGDVRAHRRGVLRGGTRSEGKERVDRVVVRIALVRAYGAADACWAWFGLWHSRADVYGIELGGWHPS